MRAAAAGLLVVALAAVPVQAQQTKTTQAAEDSGALRIGILDLEEINRKAAVFKSIRSQMEQYSNSFSAAIKSEDDVLRNANKELARQRTILSPEAYAEERRKFEKNVTDFQRQVERRKQNLNAVHAKAVIEAETALKKIIADFAKEKSIALILRSDTIVYHNKTMDMTDIVLARLDKALPSVKVPQPEK
ncbi:MAG: OmpH family outer membrane protein [Rhodospirillales bacterium]|nr:OmpH family outer membrane protein [Rhodospirillales bacterium]